MIHVYLGQTERLRQGDLQLNINNMYQSYL